MNSEPMKPAPPVTKILIFVFMCALLVLKLPVVVNARMVVRNASLVLRIVMAVWQINQNARLSSNRLISVSHTGRNQHLPRPQRPHLELIPRPRHPSTTPLVYAIEPKHSHR